MYQVCRKGERKGKEGTTANIDAPKEARENWEGKGERKGKEEFPVDFIDRLEAAYKRIAELERSAGRAENLAEVVERQSQQLAQVRVDLNEWRSRAESEGYEKVKWRARYHVARGRIDMEDE